MQRQSSSWNESHGNIRTDCYVLLAALLTGPPSAALLEVVRHLTWDDALPEKMARALATLNCAGNLCPEESIAKEFQRLFVGLGSGELVPYGSWYREKMIQSKTLAAIRADLQQLGIVRRSGCFESEDHAGALCEIMALLSTPASEVGPAEQAGFFKRHVVPWLPCFFQDMQAAKDIEFYREVGAFGGCFLEAEKEFLHNGSYRQHLT